MAKSRATLLQELNASIRSDGSGGLTTAQDLRQFLTSLVDELLDRTADAGTSVLEFVFEADNANEITRTMGVYQAGEYRTNSLQNAANVVFKINNAASPATLPFILVTGDTLQVIITRTSTSQSASVILQN